MCVYQWLQNTFSKELFPHQSKTYIHSIQGGVNYVPKIVLVYLDIGDIDSRLRWLHHAAWRIVWQYPGLHGDRNGCWSGSRAPCPDCSRYHPDCWDYLCSISGVVVGTVGRPISTRIVVAAFRIEIRCRTFAWFARHFS